MTFENAAIGNLFQEYLFKRLTTDAHKSGEGHDLLLLPTRRVGYHWLFSMARIGLAETFRDEDALAENKERI